MTKTSTTAIQNKPKRNALIKVLIAAIKKCIVHNEILPILEDVYINGETVSFTDLDSTLIFPFKAKGMNVCMPSGTFIDVIDIMNNPSFSQDDKFSVSIKEGTRVMKCAGDNPDNYPLDPLSRKDMKDFYHVADWGEDEIHFLKTALPFTSKDELRPSMTGVYVGRDIAATDAHRLYWHKIIPVPDSFILPRKAVSLLLLLGSTSIQVFVQADNSHVYFLDNNGIGLVTRVIDSRFPDYKVVIPKGEAPYNLSWEKEKLSDEVKIAKKFANCSTHSVEFTINKKASIHSADIDFSFEYANTLDGAVITKSNQGNSDVDIAFNANFLIEMLGLLPKGDDVSINIFGSTKAAIINDNFLIMPLMMNK